MLMLENTKNYLGITIRGDYNDLCELYNAIGIVSELHYKIYKKYTKQRRDINEAEKNVIIGNYDNSLQYFNILRSDIMEASEGKKGIGHVGDEKNVYYAFAILYPWAIYYMLILSELADEMVGKNELSLLDVPCTLIEYDGYQSVLKHFSMKIWDCIEIYLGKQKTFKIYTIIRDKVENITDDVFYIDAFCNYYCDNNKTLKKERKAMLLALIYEYIIYDDKEKSKEYKQAIREVENYTQEKFLSNDRFKHDMLKKYQQLGHLSQEDFDKLKESYGHVDWKHIEL